MWDDMISTSIAKLDDNLDIVAVTLEGVGPARKRYPTRDQAR
jgi:hypothetical protein